MKILITICLLLITLLFAPANFAGWQKYQIKNVGPVDLHFTVIRPEYPPECKAMSGGAINLLLGGEGSSSQRQQTFNMDNETLGNCKYYIQGFFDYDYDHVANINDCYFNNDHKILTIKYDPQAKKVFCAHE